jgi:hypothetical protein
MTVEEVLALRMRLSHAGFLPIPLYGKVPPAYGKNNSRKGLGRWQTLEDVSDDQIRLWAQTWPDAINTGILTRAVPTLDADILNEEAAVAIEEMVREQFEDSGVVLVRIGRPPKRAFPFRTDEPFSKIVITLVPPNGGTAEKLEFLGLGQQLVVSGTHPDTHKAYLWHGGEPGPIAREDLSYIREAEARELIERAAEMLVADFGYVRAAERPRRTKGKADAGTGTPRDGRADWQFLVDRILAGDALHDSLRDLAAKLATSGMAAGAAVNFLRALMESSRAPRDERWLERYNEIPRLVDSAGQLGTKANPVTAAAAATSPPRQSLAEVHAVFKKWFGPEYDLDAATAAIAAAASERLPGDPLWLLIVAGPGGAKTETVQALAGAGAFVTSTIASEGALLSASPRRQRHQTATGGLLRKIGDRATLIIKDFTSILSADRNTRACVLAAIREIYDGRWERNVGTDGGQTLTWTGRIVIVAAVTTAWDAAYAVVATMGDRFALLRLRTSAGRRQAGRGAIRNTGDETEMRRELAAAVGALVEHMDPTLHQLTDAEVDQIVKAADLVTLARSAVERDYRGEIEFAHDPEAPTRFAKQLVQLLRGAISIGVTPAEAMRLVRRCACDSIPPLRRDILLDVANNPGSRATDVRKRISKPRNTVRRGLECLHMLGALACEESEETGRDGKEHVVWRYRLADGFDRDTLQSVAGPSTGPGM